MFLQLLLLFLMASLLENLNSLPPICSHSLYQPSSTPGHCFVLDIQIFFKILCFTVLKVLFCFHQIFLPGILGKITYITTCQVFCTS